jgi:ketosteroid isomerase-like protein
MDTVQNKAVVEEFDQLGMRGGDLARLDALCTPDMVNHALAPGHPAGLAGTREFLRSAQLDVHGARWVEYFTVAENDMEVQFGSREHDWPGGRFCGFDAPAGTYVRDTAFAYRLAAERIAERWAIRDDLAMLLQLGANRSPE